MGALSPTMKKGTIMKWIVKDGDKIGVGDVLAEIQTDKALMSLESTEKGYCAKILQQEGSELDIGVDIALFVSKKEDIANIKIEDIKSETKEIKKEVKSDLKTEEATYNFQFQKIKMPALSPTDNPNVMFKIIKWLVKDGDKVKVGDGLAEIETDKTTIVFDSTESGFIKVLGKENEKFKIGETIALLTEKKEEIEKLNNYKENQKTITTNVQEIKEEKKEEKIIEKKI